ncbi:DNA translocase FtsK [Mechercharimyces sp. CAU 1602]|uniref:FtsK/SpoIIIE family DNA translocase n=1 Tax=Mechercharimyces sp. CAU 1602 TaxID=2973933 RepID=UPI002162E89A|nr:DNA translocase FtsK [Mechercharimyces sp. CAU 1602]MCS1351250.1 DNA translocase FtsK [Mechercharimyces sp. CAU 1602]
MPKKKKKQKKKDTLQQAIRFEIYGIALFTVSLIAMARLGAVGRSLSYISRFIVGTFDFLIPLMGIIIAGYIMIKRQWPQKWSARWTGILFIILALLIWNHMNTFVALRAAGEEGSVLAVSWEKILEERNSRLPTDIGGGMVGAVGYALFLYLFSNTGTPFAIVALLLVGFILTARLSFIHLFQTVRQASGMKFSEWKTMVNQRWRVHQSKSKQQGEKEEKEAPTSARVTELTQAESPVIHDFADRQLEQEKREQLSLFAEDSSVPPPVSEEGKADASGTSLHMMTEPDSAYRLPPYSLLSKSKKQGRGRERKDMTANAKKLETTLESFGVQAQVTQIHRGPTVTRYEVQPSTGVKVSRIVNLADDLALALAAKDIRIEAPIPGKAAVGIEVPNQEVSIVGLRDVLESSQYHEAKSKLSIALGRDISGEAIVADLARMPHVLVAGATGSGKSVCINGIISSLLYKAKPHEVKLMMIDPKRVELNIYNGIPHLLTPVVTDARKAAMALKKVVAEMEKRYELFAQTGAREIERYNQMIRDKKEEGLHPLPYIVVIVDELADLMMVAPQDVEEAISRLAQMARAAGIHLILATQRPSVDVITGIIKANIPSRIAFAVSSQVDSRTILDGSGAEKLLGQGDLLYLPVGASKPTRIQGVFVSDQEVDTIVHYVKEQQEVHYQEEMIPTAEEHVQAEDVDDELYPRAVQLVVESKAASASLLQRRLRVGYTRAARLIDMMENRGVVGPYEGSKPREVLITQEQWHAQRNISV